MHDEFRVQVRAKAPGEVIDALKTFQIAYDAGRELPRLAITHEGEHVFLYADSAEAAEHAREVVEGGDCRALDRRGVERDALAPAGGPLGGCLGAVARTEADRSAEHGRLEALETEESQEAGHAEWEVRITLPTHHDARSFAERLRGEGIPVEQLWRHILVGANDEDDAAALAARLRTEAPAGSEITAEGNGLEYWQLLHPYSYLGGIAN